ncbi:hypothetical protein GO491_01135 [Flavobacteriaceae bacterium Ap0902]|nr:hypothetical protein [Flavobacteriaceae bacterium Ap0902]
MKKIKFFLILLIFFTSKIICSQEVIQLKVDKSGYLESSSNSTSANKRGTASKDVVPTINGELNVNAQGALTYTVPIEVFKGINDFQPNLALAYSSDGGNGQAGYGWNIVGLSTITRGGKSKNIDGVYEGPRFDESDPFYLDGQRLIGFNYLPNSGVTEVYSTIKVSKINEGAYKFMVQYPDGKIAKYLKVAPRQYAVGSIVDSYGNEIEYNYVTKNNSFYIESIKYGKTTAEHIFEIRFIRKNRNHPIKAYRNGLEYINNEYITGITISSKEDGLYRKYILTHDISSLGQERLRSIDVENKEGEKLKTLKFNYSDSTANEVEYSQKNNDGFTRNAEKMGSVTMGDYFGDGEISATYILDEGNTKKLVNSKKGVIKDLGYGVKEIYTGKIRDSNGKVTKRDQLLMIDEVFDDYVNIEGSYYTSQKVIFNFLDLASNEKSSFFIKLPQGYRLERDGWCDGEGKYDKYKVRVLRSSAPRYYISGDFNGDGLMDILIHQLPQKGSKIKDPTGTYCESYDYDPLTVDIGTKSYVIEVGKLINSSEGILDISPFEYVNNGLDKNREHYQIEFDGDGFPEILQLNKETKKIDILKIDYLTKSIEKVIPEYELKDFTDKTPLIFGDYNGDGLTDFLTPKVVYELTQQNGNKNLINALEGGTSYKWHQYIATGKTFLHKERDFSTEKLAYLAPSSKYYIKEGGSFWKKLWSGPIYKYAYSDYGASSIIPIDFNNDGKTDLISFKKFGKGRFQEKLAETTVEKFNSPDEFISDREQCIRSCDAVGYPGDPGRDYCFRECYELDDTPRPRSITNKLVFIENVYDDDHDFRFLQNKEVDLNQKNISPFSFFINSQENNGLEGYTTKLVLHDILLKKDHVFTINDNNFFENRINEVDNSSGVIQQVEYVPLQNKDNSKGNQKACCNYRYNLESLDLPFPYFIHKQVPAKFMVSKINTLFDDKSITKEYKYQNAIQHLDGKGFLGFQKTYISDPYESKLVNKTYLPKDLKHPIFWTTNVYDPQLDNQLVEKRYGDLEGDYFTKSQISYKKYTHRNTPDANLWPYQYIYHTTQEVNHDRIKDITITKTHTYDLQGDLLLLSTNTDYNGEGTSITNFEYEPTWSVGQHYYNGKIKFVRNITKAYNDTFETRDEYSDFNDAGISRIHKKYGNKTNAVTSTVKYDSYGNKVSETVSAKKVSKTASASGVIELTTKYGYDDTKRFVTTITNPEGLKDSLEIDIYGKVLLEISGIDDKIKTKHTYDNWGNPLTSTAYYNTNIAKTTTLHKKSLEGGSYSLTTTTPGEPQSIVVFDKFDRKIKTKTQSINNKWTVVDTRYDVYGKKIKVSEPYFENEGSTLWNTIEYDELDRPIKQTLYTGKSITTCYTGRTVTVDDGEQKTSKTIDVFGNVINHKDLGGEINYTYYANGTLKEANYDGVVVTVKQDGWGNKIELNDPSAGKYEYEYDDLGRIVSESTPKGTTLYNYDDYGKLILETTEGENTKLSLKYYYDDITKLPSKVVGHNGKDKFTYKTNYDEYHRIIGKEEITPYFMYKTKTSFDAFQRPDILSTETLVLINGKKIETKVKNHYDENGIQTKLINQSTGQTLWEINQANSKGQTINMTYGNGYLVTQGYDDYFLPQSISHTRESKTALSIDYTFDPQKGILLSRSNHVFNKHENYEYDALHRLTKEILNGSTLQEYSYDKRGRFIYNTQIGKYKYQDTDYKIQNIGFNKDGEELLNARGFHNITYNSYKKAVNIHLSGKERIDFNYNIFKDRIAMYYGSEDKDINARPLHKYYSSDKAIEIKHNLQTGEIEVLTYLDGDPYSANVLQRNFFSRGNNSPPEIWYLHRDYQATILAITNQKGNILEQRYFDAWGNLKEYKDSTQKLVVVTDNTPIHLILDRGYTGHEHLWGVDLIHMNGRLYDAKLRRFLSPDNFIQNPYNTQNFNRYGYVLNNPLIYTDASGEFIGAVLIGAAIGLFTKAVINIATGQTWWYGIGKATVMGAVSGAISFGIGEVAKSASSTFVGQAAFQAGAHGYTGGFMSLLDGGDFGSGFLSGMVASVIGSGIEGLGSLGKQTEVFLQGKSFGRSAVSTFGSRNKELFKALIIASGGVSGGISSTIAGGKFSDGFKQGLITSGMNHAVHAFVNRPILDNCDKCKLRDGKYNEQSYSDIDVYKRDGNNYRSQSKISLSNEEFLEFIIAKKDFHSKISSNSNKISNGIWVGGFISGTLKKFFGSTFGAFFGGYLKLTSIKHSAISLDYQSIIDSYTKLHDSNPHNQEGVYIIRNEIRNITPMGVNGSINYYFYDIHTQIHLGTVIENSY